MTRDQKLIGLFSALAVLCGGVVGIQLGFDQPPPVAVIERTVGLGADGQLSVQFVGNTLLGDAAQPLIDRYGYDWPLAAVAPMLDGDYVIAGAEAPITARTQPFDLGKEFSYGSPPQIAPVLAGHGVDAVNLATNHTFDRGPAGLADTIRHAESAGLAAFGAGPDLARAERPLLLRTALGTLGVIGIGEHYGSASQARDAAPGTLVLSPQRVRRGADLARAAGADWVIATVHWGANYEPVDAQQRHWAQTFADAGYDAVIGTGPHRVQPIEFIGRMPVAYSLGNFVFGTPGRFKQYQLQGFGLILGLELSRSGGTRLSLRCLRTDNDEVDFQPRPCTAEQARSFLPTVHPEVIVDRDRGLLACPCLSRKAQP
jgi:hypothetical protein